MDVILTFQGFTESIRSRTGTEDLYFSVIRKFANQEVTTYQPQTWTANVKELAAQLARQRAGRVALVSYSHGQDAACDFAREAYSLGLKVDLWLACDPVFRPSWIARLNIFQPFAIRALTKGAKIKVPENIRRVAGVRQKVSWPWGHDLIATSPNTKIDRFEFLPYTHTSIDSAEPWFQLVESELEAWTNPPKAIPLKD